MNIMDGINIVGFIQLNNMGVSRFILLEFLVSCY